MWFWVPQCVPNVIKSQMCKFQAAKPFSQKHMNLTCPHMCTYMTNMCSHVKFMCIFHKGLPHKIYINSFVKARLTVILSRDVRVRLAGLCVVDVWPGQMVYRVPTFATDLYPFSQCRITPHQLIFGANHQLNPTHLITGPESLGYLGSGELQFS